jgi:poly-gamma-glutamate synthesis protein (capsule biosynthesis protein)
MSSGEKQVNGDTEKPMDFTYIWGDALIEMQHQQADARIIILETSVTTSDN